MALTLVLSIGLDVELLSTRNLVLQSAGYLVVPAYSLKEAVDRFQDGDFDLVLLCQSIPTKEKDRLTRWIRASGSRVPVLSVSASPRLRDGHKDETFGSDPNSLLEEIREALIGAETPATRASTFRKASAGGKKAPETQADYERQPSIISEHHVPLAHPG